ncbi:MAG: hypothetical protein HC846_01105 [Blastocatellia bacterium]|nr:hypothetical protein [Blastocatellia bacterium]
MQTNLSQAQNPAFDAMNYTPITTTVKPEIEGEIRKTSVNEPLIYEPHWITGGAKHPGLIVETPGLANVAPPPITYRPSLPHRLNNLGLISEVQFERVIYAGQAHEQRLANGARAGISIGDGTGAGKTSSLAGIILDNWFRGNRKTVLVFSQNRFNRSRPRRI